MKYEMIFGNEKLFDGAPDDVDMISYNGEFYKNSQNGPMYRYGCTFTTDEYRNEGFIAMRRIIKEPKQWTWKDKKAGRLPDVGAKYAYDGVEVTCHHINKAGDIWGHTKNGDVWCQSINEITPIETPAEKAQREEDEFVVAMLDAASQEQLMSAGFKSGVIAAYRKLKGGE